MYRPEGWENLYRDATKPANRELGEKWFYFEAGADAMLEDVNDWLKPLGLVFKEDGLYHISGRDDKW